MQCCVHKKTGTFTHSERITQVSVIKELFKKGKKYAVGGAKLFVLPNCFEQNRIVFTFPRGYGTSVERNHSKRISREAYRSIRSQLQMTHDFLLLIYPGRDTYIERCTQLYILFEKANVLVKKT